MEKNRKDIENEILNEEKMGEEEDYEEYARLREEREGIRSRKERIAQEEQRRQAMEYERIRIKEAQERQAREEQKKISSYERRKKKKHPIRNFVLAVLVLLLVAAGGSLFYLRSLLQTVDSVDLEDALQSSISSQVKEDATMAGYQNIALFGVDSREQDLLGGNNRSDSIMICSINKKTGEIKLASVYRDTLLDIGGGEYRKCNAAYAFGGPQQAVAMLNTNLDLNITDFVTVGFEGLADTIDALGGIDLEITEEEMEYMNSYMEDMYYQESAETENCSGTHNAEGQGSRPDPSDRGGKCGIGRDGDFAEHRGTLQVYSQGKDDGSDGEHRISYRGGQNLCDDRRGILRGSLLSDDECQRTA